jgi:hypothetical protein
MAVQFTIAFAAFFVENENFLAAALVVEYFANHFSTLYNWGTYFYLTVVVNEKHFVECQLSTFLSFSDAVNKELFASLNLVLEALHFYNCVHLLNVFNKLHRSGEMQSPRRWHTEKWYHPSPQQRYLEAQKPKKRAKVLLFFELTKYFFIFLQKALQKSIYIPFIRQPISQKTMRQTTNNILGKY